MGSRYALARAFKKAQRTAGHVTFSSTTPTALDTALDLTLAASVGDEIEVGVNGAWGGSGTTNYGALDVASLVAGSAVNWWGTGIGGANYGIVGWLSLNANQDRIFGGSKLRTIVAGDIASGYVTLRLFGWVTTAGSKQVFADTALPFQFWAKNLGPVDPN